MRRERLGSQRLRQAEIEHLGHAVRTNNDVARLEISVDDACGVRGLDSLGDLQRQLQCLAHGHCTCRDPVANGFALDQFHDQELGVGLVLEAMQRRDVGVVERRQNLRLTLEPRHPFGYIAEPLG